METYRLKSKLVENDKEYIIQTSSDSDPSRVSTVVYVNGQATELVQSPHPAEVSSEEVLSLVKVKHGEMKKEIETLLEAFRSVSKEGDPRKLYHLGMAFFYKKLYDEACDLFEKAVRFDDQMHQAYNQLGMTYLQLGRVPEAVKASSSAVAARPGFADYRNNLAEALMAGRSFKRAVIELEEAIRINLYYADAYFNLGLALLENAVGGEDTSLFDNVLTKSTDCFKRAALIQPEFECDDYQQGLAAIAESRLDEACRLLKKVRIEKKERHRRNFTQFYMRFVLYPEWVSEEAISERIAFLQAEIGRNPSYVDLYSELGRCCFERARISWQKGVEQYRRVVDMNPALTKLAADLAEATKQYEAICGLLGRMAQRS